MIIVFFSVFLIAMLTLWLSTSLMYVANDHSSLNNSFSAAQGRDIFMLRLLALASLRWILFGGFSHGAFT